ncbi:MAG: twin-arginine translocation signal domain-containing protein, partial [Sphingomonadales bacterium]|nr:twin-arginine translocation signal domain-containing protein [Sphingomonadales bacterium]
MANPSHSTASPDPRTPQDDAQPDSRGRGNDSEANGNDGGGGNPQEALDRRTLLTGAAAAAAAAGAGLATAGMPGLDPVVAVYRGLLKLQADPLNDYCDED